MKTILSVFYIMCLLGGCAKKELPKDTRPFYMAATPWPADFTPEAIASAYNFIQQNCDMVSHHFDEGIPYEEALRGTAWPQHLKEDLQFRKSNSTGKTVLVSSAALNLTRHEKADYYHNTDSPVPDSTIQKWKNMPMNDARMVTAYVNFVSFLIDQLHPKYVNYGVESNDYNWEPSQFAQYKDFLSKVYHQLKTKYTDLPFFVSVMVNEDARALSYAGEVLVSSDLVGLSSYPYMASASTADGNTDPSKFATNFFTRYLDLAPEKPWGFAETGYIAQDLSIPAFSIARKGTAEWQKDYLQRIFNLCRDRKAKFLIWFCSADYDAASARLKSLGLYDDLFGLWQDIGFIDENNNKRPSYELWSAWRNKALR